MRNLAIHIPVAAIVVSFIIRNFIVLCHAERSRLMAIFTSTAAAAAAAAAVALSQRVRVNQNKRSRPFFSK
jgi:hypothetical protein